MSSPKFAVPPSIQKDALRCRGKKEAFVFCVKIETGDNKWWTSMSIAVFWRGRTMIACANESRLCLFSKYPNRWERIEPDGWTEVEAEIERFAIALACRARCLFRDNIKTTFKPGHAISDMRIKETDDSDFKILT